MVRDQSLEGRRERDYTSLLAWPIVDAARAPSGGHVAERDEQPAGPATRSAANQGTIITRSHDEEGVAQVVGPLLQRVDASAGTLQAIIVTADADDALAFARRAVVSATGVTVLPATSESRALRLIRRGGTRVIAGPPSTLVELMRHSALKLEDVRNVVIAWADAILAADEGDALDVLMAEVPKDAARVLVASQLTPSVEALAERYFRRAHRLTSAPPAEGLSPVVMSYVTVTALSRPAALRRVLDEIDPPSAAISVRDEISAAEVRRTLRELGYDAADPSISVVTGAAPADVSLIILYDLPLTAEQLRSVVGAGTPRVVGFARPRELERLGAIAGLAPTPLPAREATSRARRAQDALRDELRAEMRRGAPDRHVVALEPLLDEFDAIELAGAALRLLERTRERAAIATAAAAASSAASAQAARPPAFTRLFVTVGTRDNVGPGDLVGMITAEGGITSAQIGKIDIRDNHSLVEVAAPVADQVVAKVSGASVKGRRIVVRPERTRDERAAREGGDRPRPRAGEMDRPRPRPGADREGRPSRGPADRGGRAAGGEGRPPRRDSPPRRGPA